MKTDLDIAQPFADAGILGNATGQFYPFSIGQKALWILYQRAPTSSAYHVAAAFVIREEIDITILQRALHAVARRHEALRTRIKVRGGEPGQFVDPTPSLAITVVPANDLSEQQLQDRMSDVTQMPFDLAHGPLLRYCVYQRSAHESVLQLVAHHIVFDMASLDIVLKEFGEFYAAYRRGIEPTVPAVALQYHEFSERQEAMLRSPVGSAHADYWRSALSGPLPVLELPTDRPRPTVQTYRGGQVNIVLGAELTEGIAALSRAQGVGRYMTLLAAYGALLSRYSDQSELLIGFPTSGRTDPELADVVGYLVNPVVLRVRCERETAAQLLVHVRDTAVEALYHRDYPFPALVESLKLQRDVSHAPVFQTLFVWQKEVGAALGMPGAHVAAGGLDWEVVGLDPGAAQFDLALLAGLVEDRVAITLKFNSDLFERATVERLAEHYQQLLRAMVAAPQQKVAHLALLTPEETQHQRMTWNDTATPFDVAPNLALAFSTQKDLSPDASAVTCNGHSLTYRELDRRADTVARQLLTAGVGPEAIVALAVERSVEMIVALLGIWKAGGAYLPIDPALPPERVHYQLQDSAAKILVTGEGIKDRFTSPGCTVLTIEALLSAREESERDQTDRTSQTSQGNGAGPDSLAYVLYTSGSTGTPRGVMVTHGSVLNLSHALQKAIYADLGAGPLRVSVNAPLAFDASVKQIVQLLSGHCLVLVPEELRRDPAGLLGFLATTQIDVMDCTPSLLKPLLRAGLLDRFATQRPTFLLGGEAIDSDLWRTLRRSRGPEFYNVYGPTECTVNTTVCNIRRLPTPEGDVPTLGRPLANTQIYILDDQLQLRPMGVAGELVIGGAGVARGYLNRPELTAERFIENPFAPGKRLYRTGDRARFRADGSVDFLGRLDNQVKIRGYRVELEEIECVLKKHPDVAEAAVILQEDASGERVPVAYVVPGADCTLAGEELRDFLKRSLPDYMMPGIFMQVAASPVTWNGKLDRAALSAVEASRLETVVAQGTPRTQLEAALAAMWAQLLGLEQVGIHDDFFELGGHSLLVIQMIGQLQVLFPTDVPLLTVFFSQPTVAGLAEALSESSAGEGSIDTIVQMLDRLANLSEAELDEMLYAQSSYALLEDDMIDV